MDPTRIEGGIVSVCMVGPNPIQDCGCGGEERGLLLGAWGDSTTLAVLEGVVYVSVKLLWKPTIFLALRFFLPHHHDTYLSWCMQYCVLCIL